MLARVQRQPVLFQAKSRTGLQVPWGVKEGWAAMGRSWSLIHAVDVVSWL